MSCLKLQIEFWNKFYTVSHIFEFQMRSKFKLFFKNFKFSIWKTYFSKSVKFVSRIHYINQEIRSQKILKCRSVAFVSLPNRPLPKVLLNLEIFYLKRKFFWPFQKKIAWLEYFYSYSTDVRNNKSGANLLVRRFQTFHFFLNSLNNSQICAVGWPP